MQGTLKLALRLMVFALISGLLLSLTNAVTKEPIRLQEERSANASRIAIFPDAEAYIKVDKGIPDAYPDVDEVYLAVRGEETLGYALSLSPYGYKSDILLTLGVRTDGSIEKLKVSSQSETAGLGSLVAEEPFLSQFDGLSADPNALSNSVDAITGATISSSAVISAVQSGLLYAKIELNVAAE